MIYDTKMKLLKVKKKTSKFILDYWWLKIWFHLVS